MGGERAGSTDARSRELEQRAEQLMAAGDGRGSMTALEEAVALTIDADEPAIAARGRWLLERKAASLHAMTAHEAAAAEYERLARAAVDAPEPERSRVTALALGGRAIALGAGLRTEEAVAGFDGVIERFGDHADAEVRATVGSAAYNRAIVLRDAGRVADAFAAFDDVVRRFGDDRSADLDQWTALASINKAALLAAVGRVDEALDLYQDVAFRFGNSLSDMARERAARAALQYAHHLEEAGRADEALACYRDTADRFGHAREPAIRSHAAVALLAMAALFERGQRSEEAHNAAAEVVRRFGDDADPAVRERVDAARSVLDQGEPVSHALDDPMRIATHDELREDLLRTLLKMVALPILAVLVAGAALVLVPGDLTRRALVVSVIAALTVALEVRWRRRGVATLSDIEANREQRRKESESQASLDEVAQRTVAEFFTTGRPYALYLRSFDVDAGGRQLVDIDGKPHWVGVMAPRPSPVEAGLAAGLGGRVPIVGIQNPADIWTSFTTAIPKLALPTDGWQQVLDDLIAGADLIVMVPVGLSPGVSTELAAIVKQRRQADTVVLITGGTPDDVESATAFLAITGARLPNHERLAVTSPELASFPRVVFSEELDFDALDSHPLFADLLERVAFLTALEPEQRQQARDARLAEDAGSRLVGTRDPADAVRRLEGARLVQDKLGDRLGLVATLHAIGLVRLDAGDVAGARTALEDALARCAVGDVVPSGPILGLLAVCHHAAGDLKAAISTLNRAVDALTAGGSRGQLCEALTRLGHLLALRGEPEAAADLLARAAALEPDAGDDA